MSYRASPSLHDRMKAVAGVISVYAVMVGALLLVPTAVPTRLGDGSPTVLIDIIEPPPPEPPPETDLGKAEEEEGAAGKKAEPTQIVAPTPKVKVPAKSPVIAAPIAGTGSDPTAGAATEGTGPGAGGSGSGRGGGGSGGGGGSTGPRLLGGNSAALPSWLLRPFATDRGHAHLWLTVAESGRVSDCDVLETTGDAQVDQALCSLMLRQSRWAPARNREGHPISSRVRYTATWSKY